MNASHLVADFLFSFSAPLERRQQKSHVSAGANMVNTFSNVNSFVQSRHTSKEEKPRL